MRHNDSGNAWGYGMGDSGKRLIEQAHKEIDELRAEQGRPPIDWTVTKPKAREYHLRKAVGA